MAAFLMTFAASSTVLKLTTAEPVFTPGLVRNLEESNIESIVPKGWRSEESAD